MTNRFTNLLKEDIASEGEKRLTTLFLFIVNRINFISDVRQMALVGLPLATKQLEEQALAFARSLGSDPKYDGLIKDQKEFLRQGMADKIGSAMVENSLNNYNAAIDATSLIFAHSVLDSVAYDCCEISATIAPDDWVADIKSMKLELGDALTYERDALITANIQKLLSRIERMSLLKKIEFIFKRCPPPNKELLTESYTFDRDRLLQLDQLRHDIIHSNKPLIKLPRGDKDIYFFRQTCVFLLVLLHHRYNIKINPGLLPEILTKSKE